MVKWISRLMYNIDYGNIKTKRRNEAETDAFVICFYGYESYRITKRDLEGLEYVV